MEAVLLATVESVPRDVHIEAISQLLLLFVVLQKRSRVTALVIWNNDYCIEYSFKKILSLQKQF